MNETQEKSRITIRSVPADVLQALTIMAASNDRSLEAEARFALHNAALPYLMKVERGQRLHGLAARLNDTLMATNRKRRDGDLPPLKPSHLAEAIGENYAEAVYGWFEGTQEPSFAQVKALAAELHVDAGWLQHGDEEQYIAKLRSEGAYEVR